MKNSVNRRVIAISSESNKTYRELHSLVTGRGVRRYGRTLVSGSKVIREIIHQNPEIIVGVVTFPDGPLPPEDLPSAIDSYSLSRSLFSELDVNGTRYPLLVDREPKFEEFREDRVTDSLILFVPFQDPANVGAVVRSAAAFGVESIVLLKEAANPYLPKSIRAAGTPLFSVRFFSGPSIDDVGGYSIPVVALSAEGKTLRDFNFPPRFILLPGLEGKGLPSELQPDHLVSIPMSPHVESLNAAVAVSVVLYEWRISS